ncbi:MAG: HEAT repeat domain-containing protein, partial [Cyanobacteria bacterium P01_G01_bin.49]
RQPNTPHEILAQLTECDLEEVRIDLLNKGWKPQSTEVLDEWVNDQTDFLANIVQHPQVSKEILDQLADFPNPKVQLAVAQNHKTSEQIRLQLLGDLSTHPNEKIRSEVAKDLNTPVFILENMVRQEVYPTKIVNQIRQILSTEYKKNASSFQSVAHKFMSEIKLEILDPAGITINVDSWMEVIESLGLIETITNTSNYHEADNELYKKMMFKYTPLWAELLPSLSGEKRGQVVRKLQATLAMATGQIQEVPAYRSIAAILVGNPNTPIALREKLKNKLIRPNVGVSGYYSDRDVITALAYNPSIPEPERMKYFEQLLSIRNNEYVAKNPNTPPEILLQIMSQPGTGRQAVSRNPNAPHSALEELAKDENRTTRNWVAENPGTPSHILIQLARDYDHSVRESALKNPNLPLLNRYQILLEQEEQKAIEKANQILAQRTDSLYALARVLETGDQQAKISAARNCKTPIHVLEQLAKDEDETVRQVMAQNRNLPLNILLELADDSSVRVRSNLAYKNTYSKIQTPIKLLEKLAQDESEVVREKVAAHSDTPEELLTQLANDSSTRVKEALTGNLNTPVTVLNRLGLEENLVNKRNSNTPGEVLASRVNSLLRSPRQNDPRWKNLESTNKGLVELLKHPIKGTQMPADTLAKLANHHYPSVRYRVAAHPNTPTYILERLADDSYIATVRAVASNVNTPPSALEYLANNADLTTRISIVRHPNTPARVLMQMVEDAQTSDNAPNRTKDSLKSAVAGNAYDLLREIATNSKTPINALEIIARREFVSPPTDPKSILPPRTDNDVMRSLVYNPSLTPELLNILTQDNCVDVRVALIRHPNLTEALWIKLAEDTDISVRKAVASSTNAPVSILETLAQDTVVDVRIEVAQNQNTPSQILEQLSQDKEATVRTKIAANLNTSNTVLERLAKDEKIEVRRAVAHNPNISEYLRESLRDLLPKPTTNTQQISPTLRGLSRLYNPNTDDLASLLSEYVQSDVPFVRFVSLLHPLTPVEILENAANSISWIERYAVANNPDTSTAIKQQLTQDSNRIVKATAIATR